MTIKSAGIPVAPTIAMLVMLVILLALGGWQVKRLAWKTTLLADMEQVYRADPVLDDAAFVDASRAGKPFLHGHVEGHFLNDKALLIGPRTLDGAVGYHVLAPFQLVDGGTVLVNRGWVPLESGTAPARPGSLIEGQTVVTGLARLPERSNIFVPANRPDSGQWYSIDLEQMGAKTGLSLAPYVIYAEGPGDAKHPPVPVAADWRPPNNHLQYAIFWFLMAGLLVIFYWLRFIVRQPQAL